MAAIQTPVVINGVSVGLAAFQVVPSVSYATTVMVQNLEATANLYLAIDSAATQTFVKITPGGYWEFPTLDQLSTLTSAIYGIFDAAPALTKSATITVVK